MARRDGRVSEYIRKCEPFARPILRHLRKTIHAGAAELEEAIKWRMPTFLYRGKIVCGIAGFRNHCAFWFREGRHIVGGKKGDAMGYFGRITHVKDLPLPAKLKGYVRKAVKRIDRKLSAR